jgi:FixJ family two-component response regulator
MLVLRVGQCPRTKLLEIPVADSNAAEALKDEFLVATTEDQRKAFRSLGYEPHGYASAVEFISRGREGSCDCIITDFEMPGMSGLDLIRLLNARGSTVPVIMISGSSEPGPEAKAAADGAFCRLTKPFEAGALIGLLEAALKI